jgi:hypothetical protein
METSAEVEISQGDSEQKVLGRVIVRQSLTVETTLANGWSIRVSKTEGELWLDLLNASYAEEVSVSLQAADLNELSDLFRVAEGTLNNG